MRKLIAIFLVFACIYCKLSGQVINIPADYPTIQEGIHAASEDDTVLVAPGTYYENLALDGTNITLASLFLITSDTSYISATVIDGGQAGTVLTINHGEDSTTLVCGFSITNGLGGFGGGGLLIGESSPTLGYLNIYGNKAANGGGIYISESFSTIDHCRIINNSSEKIGNWSIIGGGGVCIYSNNNHITLQNSVVQDNSTIESGGGLYSYSPLDLMNVDFIGNSAYYGGGLYCGLGVVMDPVDRCNIHSNRATEGNDMFTFDTVHVLVDTFSVINPTGFHVRDISHFLFDIRYAKLVQVNADLYVSPEGDDHNSGLDPGHPLKTIHSAQSRMLPFSGDTNTIFLAEGIYSPGSTNEYFPVPLLDYIYLRGENESTTILDAQGSGSVVRIDENSFNEVSDLTLTGGNWDNGGGIFCSSDNTTLRNLIIQGNEATNGGGICVGYCGPTIRDCNIQDNAASVSGGGIFLVDQSYSGYHPHLKNVSIKENHAKYGGGIAMTDSEPVLEDVTICYNSADQGGGISNGGYPVFDAVNRCNIFLNTAAIGNDLTTGPYLYVTVDTFTVMEPTEFHASERYSFSFDILKGKLEQAESDLYVSPDGDDSNSGLSADDPLKTIHHAQSIILATSNSQRQIHLLEGTYSPGTNGEFFPVNLCDYVDLSGTVDSLVILDADSSARVLQIIGNDTNRVSDLTIRGGYDGDGAGICVVESNPYLERLVITNNSTNNSGAGGGIYSSFSEVVMRDITITGNNSMFVGGGIYSNASTLKMNGMIITDNTALNSGGGIYLSYSDARSQMNQMTISGNEADDGGGIYNFYGSLKLTDCEISNNIGSDEGGGIYSLDSIWLDHCIIANNMASYGGGMFLRDHSFARLDTIEVVGNNSSYRGGGLAFEEYSHVELNQVNIHHNITENMGGGILAERWCDLSLHGSRIIYNQAVVGGGIAWWSYASTDFDSIDRCDIYLNDAQFGNDLYSSWDTVEVIVDTFTVLYPTDHHAELKNKFSFNILSGKIEQIDADLYVSPGGDDANSGMTPEEPLRTIHSAFKRLRSGADHQHTVHLANGIYSPSTTGEIFPIAVVNHSSLSGEFYALTILDAENTSSVLSLGNDTIPLVEHLTLTGGQASRGGGIACLYSKFKMDYMKVHGNTSSDVGGGIYIGFCGNSTLSNMNFDDNTSGNGGGIGIRNSSLDFYAVNVRNNSAVNGGGISLESSDTIRMDHMNILNNSASEEGGGIFASSIESLTIFNAVFDLNSARKGGGIWSSYTSPVMKNSLVVNNSATLHSGGVGLYNDFNGEQDFESKFFNSTFSNNTAPGLFCYSAGVDLYNDIFWGNEGQYQIQYNETGTRDDTLRVSHTDIYGGITGIAITGSAVINWYQGNINSDPLFMLNGDYPFALDDGSPCIDSGTPDTTGLFLPLNDILGNYRVWDGDGDGEHIIDMGPYEYGAPVSIREEGKFQHPASCNFTVFPNPVSDYLTIRSQDNTKDQIVRIVSCSGQLIHSCVIPAGQQNTVISLNSFPAGLYSLIICDEDGSCQVIKVAVFKD